MSLSTVSTGPRTQETSSVRDRYLAWYFAFFVISGFCGLVYEVVWIRLAMASFGVTTALVSIVLSVFMGGLGIGSWLSGLLIKRSGKLAARSLLLYAAAEFLIGCSALLVPLEFKVGRNLMLHTGSWGAWQSWSYYLLAGIWLSIALLPWCTLLGSTYPLLMSVIRLRSQAVSSRSFSYLYLANVLGALCGTLISAFVLIELLGFRRTLWVGAGLNAVLALLALRLDLNFPRLRVLETHTSAEANPGSLYGFGSRAILLMLFITGFVSMGAEVVWMRQFTPYLGNFVYAFAIVLGVYLLATALGARDYRNWSRSHSANESVTTWSLLAISAVIPVLGASPQLHIPDSLAGVRIVSILFFCALTGFLTPLLVDSWSAGDPGRAGTAYAFNILGCIVGPLVASFGLETWLGERWSILILSLPLFAIAAVLTSRRGGSMPASTSATKARLMFVVAAISAVVLFSISKDYETIFPVKAVRRDYAATVIAAGTGQDKLLLVNGTGMTILTPITKYIAHLPLASMSRPPRNGLVICFGMGTTFRSMVAWGIPTTAVDLIPSVPKLFSYFHSDASQVEASSLAHIVVDDGRRFLDGSEAKYDVIVVDPPPPVPAPGSSLLYSREFYEIIKKHLNHDGILQMWYPSVDGDEAPEASVTKTLAESFPYVRAFRSYDNRFGIHFLASEEPIAKIPGVVLASRMPARAASDFVEWGPETDAAREFDLVLTKEIPLQDLIGEDPQIPPLSDDSPINEYFLLRRWFKTAR